MEIESLYYLPYVVVEMLELYYGALDVPEILKRWYVEQANSNYGAYIPFIGTVRAEGGIEALSFDIYEPILQNWFGIWRKKAEDAGAFVVMAHSIGDVKVHESSYIAAVFSPKRRVALELIDEYVEDFKASAPIWKYDVINGQRIYAKERSTQIKGSGLLGVKI
jgi:molybdopterin synthase catalytic subunit